MQRHIKHIDYTRVDPNALLEVFNEVNIRFHDGQDSLFTDSGTARKVFSLNFKISPSK